MVNDITVIRGDFNSFKFQRRNESGEVVTDIPSNIYFTVKRNSDTSDFVFQKKLSDGTILFNDETNYYTFDITPDDTNKLHYGFYEWDIEVMLEEGKPLTIAIGELTISREVTFNVNEG